MERTKVRTKNTVQLCFALCYRKIGKLIRWRANSHENIPSNPYQHSDKRDRMGGDNSSGPFMESFFRRRVPGAKYALGYLSVLWIDRRSSARFGCRDSYMGMAAHFVDEQSCCKLCCDGAICRICFLGARLLALKLAFHFRCRWLDSNSLDNLFISYRRYRSCQSTG